MTDFDNQEQESRKKGPSGRKPEKIVRSTPSKKQKRKKEVTKELIVTKKKKSSGSSDGSLNSILVYLYKNLYIIGMFVIRWWRRTRKKLKRKISRFRGGIWHRIDQLTNSIRRSYSSLRRKIKAPFRRTKEIWQEQQPQIQALRKNKKIPWKPYGKILRQIGRNLWLIFRSFFNYAAPVLAGLLLFTIVDSQINQPIGLNVTYKGHYIGCVEKEKDFDKALKDVDSRMASGEASDFTAGVPLFEVVTLGPEDTYSTLEDLSDGIIRVSSDEIVPAYGLYVNDELLGAVPDSQEVLDELQEIRDRNSTGKQNEEIRFGKNIRFSQGLYPSTSMVTDKDLIDILNSEESAEEVYVVQSGDTPSGVADKLGVPVATLEELNPGFEDDFPIGKELRVAMAKPFLPIKNVYTDIYDQELPFETVEVENTLYAKGYKNVEQVGVPGVGRVTAEITMMDGIEVSREIVDVEEITSPIDEKVTVGVSKPQVIAPPKTQPGTSGGGTVKPPEQTSLPPQQAGFIWPAQSGWVGTGLWGYPGHTGVDINGTGGYGAPVYASASGTVTKAKWSYVGYGNHIVIDHGNGYTTLYGHNTTLYVNVGDYVQQGQIIATVGSTGNSSGPHIHFEVRYNGQILNPINFVGTRR